MAQHNCTRRQFLKTTAASGAVFGIRALGGHPSPTTKGPMTRVALIGGIPTFVCNGKAVLRTAFETYVATRHYFEQFASAGTRIFGFSTNAAACDYGHSKTTWIEADTWDYSQFEQRAAVALPPKPDALLLPRVNLGTQRCLRMCMKSRIIRV